MSTEGSRIRERVPVTVEFTNDKDLVLARLGMLSADRVRGVTISGLVDTGFSYVLLPASVVAQLGLKGRTKISYGTTAGGWPGDVPHSRMDASKIRKAGFNLPRSSDEAVQLAIRRIIEWLPQRKGAKDDLRLPKDARPGRG